jgi:hypothetical protein
MPKSSADIISQRLADRRALAERDVLAAAACELGKGRATCAVPCAAELASLLTDRGVQLD